MLALVKQGFSESEVLNMTGPQQDAYLEILLGESVKQGESNTRRFVNKRRINKKG